MNLWKESYNLNWSIRKKSGPGSVVGIATVYGVGGSGDRIPVEARFSAPLQTGRGAHAASCTMGTGSFAGVKSGRSVTLTPLPLLVQWSWKCRAKPLLPCGPYGLYRTSVHVQGECTGWITRWMYRVNYRVNVQGELQGECTGWITGWMYRVN
jgi:hypothetical protein